jgi:hypothetical protein
LGLLHNAVTFGWSQARHAGLVLISRRNLTINEEVTE